MGDDARTWKLFWWLVVGGFIVGSALGFVSLLLEMNCHRGTYSYPGLAHAIFPPAGLVAHSETFGFPVAMILALTQFPLYGACVGFAYKKWKHGAWIALALLLTFHVAIFGANVVNA